MSWESCAHGEVVSNGTVMQWFGMLAQAFDDQTIDRISVRCGRYVAPGVDAGSTRFRRYEVRAPFRKCCFYAFATPGMLGFDVRWTNEHMSGKSAKFGHRKCARAVVTIEGEVERSRFVIETVAAACGTEFRYARSGIRNEPERVEKTATKLKRPVTMGN